MIVDIDFRLNFRYVRDAIEHVLDDIEHGRWEYKTLFHGYGDRLLCKEIIYCQSETGEEHFECVVEEIDPDGEQVQKAIQKMMAKSGYNVRVIAKED
jgi:hypothetical protein